VTLGLSSHGPCGVMSGWPCGIRCIELTLVICPFAKFEQLLLEMRGSARAPVRNHFAL